MEVVISATPDEAGRLAADAVSELVQRSPEAVLGVATGSSPLIIYDELGRRVAQGSLSLAEARRSCLTSTSGCRQTIRSGTATSSEMSLWTRSTSILPTCLGRTGWPRTWRALARRTNKP